MRQALFVSPDGFVGPIDSSKVVALIDSTVIRGRPLTLIRMSNGREHLVIGNLATTLGTLRKAQDDNHEQG